MHLGAAISPIVIIMTYIVSLLDVISNSHEGLRIIGLQLFRAIVIVWLRHIVQLSVGSFSVFGSLR